MESYLVIALLLVGALLGGVAVWLYGQQQLRRVEARHEEAEEGARRSIKQMMENNRKLEDEVFAEKKQIDQLHDELAAANRRLASLADELQDGSSRFRELSGQLQTVEQQLHRSELELTRIPALEGEVAAREQELARRAGEIERLHSTAAELTEQLAEEKRSLDECIIFVEGSHYLPGRVVRNLIGANQS